MALSANFSELPLVFYPEELAFSVVYTVFVRKRSVSDG
jgi:hypothetical protein